MPKDPFFSISTNARSFELSFHDNETFDEPETRLDDSYPLEPEKQTAREPLRLMIVFQVQSAWFFYVNGRGDNPVFDNYDAAWEACHHVLRVLKGEVIPWGYSPRKTVKTDGVVQVCVTNVPMVK